MVGARVLRGSVHIVFWGEEQNLAVGEGAGMRGQGGAGMSRMSSAAACGGGREAGREEGLVVTRISLVYLNAPAD